MEPAHERELVARCRRDEPGAFEELVDQFKNLVFALIARTVPDRSRAEDRAQDVFLRIHRGLPYFRGEARLSTWIFRIVVNICTQENDRLRPAISLDDPDSRLPAPGAVDPASPTWNFAIVWRGHRAAAPAVRLLIAGHYLEGVQYEDLAEAMNLPLDTVKPQLHRAKRQLRQLLEGDLK